VAYNKLTTRQKYAKNDTYRKFKESVWEVNHQDAMRTIKDMLPRGHFFLCCLSFLLTWLLFVAEEGDSDSDSDIEVGGMTQTYKCPLTFMYFTNPMTSYVICIPLTEYFLNICSELPVVTLSPPTPSENIYKVEEAEIVVQQLVVTRCICSFFAKHTRKPDIHRIGAHNE
jgi:hypothetical protein